MARILLVEDDDNVRLLLEHVLLHEGYAVETAGTVARGERLLQDSPYDLVLADVKLPDGNGLRVLDAATRRGAGHLRRRQLHRDIGDPDILLNGVGAQPKDTTARALTDEPFSHPLSVVPA